jgi:tetratricopeptide (TPR) repeat protein
MAPKAVELLDHALRWHPKDTSVMVNLAMACAAAEAPSRARALLEEVLQIEPANLDARLLLVDNLLNLGRTEDALRQVEQAARLEPKAPQVHLASGNVMLALDKGEDALQAFRKARELDPRNHSITLDIGDVLLRVLNRPDEALAEFRKAAAASKAFAAAHIRVADVLLRMGKASEAKVAIDEVRNLMPNQPVVKALEERLAGIAKP